MCIKNTIYYNALVKSSEFKSSVKTIWNKTNGIVDISSKIEEMRVLFKSAAEYDAKLWDVNHNPNNKVFTDFDGHVDYLKDVLVQRYNVVSDEINTY